MNPGLDGFNLRGAELPIQGHARYDLPLEHSDQPAPLGVSRSDDGTMRTPLEQVRSRFEDQTTHPGLAAVTRKTIIFKNRADLIRKTRAIGFPSSTPTLAGKGTAETHGPQNP